MNRVGFPAYILFDSILQPFDTTDAAPITTLSGTVAPGRNIVPCPTITLFPKLIGLYTVGYPSKQEDQKPCVIIFTSGDKPTSSPIVTGRAIFI